MEWHTFEWHTAGTPHKDKIDPDNINSTVRALAMDQSTKAIEQMRSWPWLSHLKFCEGLRLSFRPHGVFLYFFEGEALLKSRCHFF